MFNFTDLFYKSDFSFLDLFFFFSVCRGLFSHLSPANSCRNNQRWLLDCGGGTATSEVALNNCSFFHAFKPVKCEKRFVIMNWPLKRLPPTHPPSTPKNWVRQVHRRAVLWPLESLLISTYCSKCGSPTPPLTKRRPILLQSLDGNFLVCCDLLAPSCPDGLWLSRTTWIGLDWSLSY